MPTHLLRHVRWGVYIRLKLHNAIYACPLRSLPPCELPARRLYCSCNPISNSVTTNVPDAVEVGTGESCDPPWFRDLLAGMTVNPPEQTDASLVGPAAPPRHPFQSSPTRASSENSKHLRPAKKRKTDGCLSEDPGSCDALLPPWMQALVDR